MKIVGQEEKPDIIDIDDLPCGVVFSDFKGGLFMKLSSYYIYDLVEKEMIEEDDGNYVSHVKEVYTNATLDLGVPAKTIS